MKRITSYDQFKNILPYASEMFGVYQSLLGWKSQRRMRRIEQGIHIQDLPLITQIAKHFKNETIITDITNDGCEVAGVKFDLGEFASSGKLIRQELVILQEISKRIKNRKALSIDEWQNFLINNDLKEILNTIVFPYYKDKFQQQCRILNTIPEYPEESSTAYSERINVLKHNLQEELLLELKYESSIARAIIELINTKAIIPLNKIFYTNLNYDSKTAFLNIIQLLSEEYKDPFLTFDPKKDVNKVSLSPLGIVHLFRQYFFEFDTFYVYQAFYNQAISTTSLPSGNKRKTITIHLPIDVIGPSIFCHAQIGHHNDGYTQGLYLYLRIFEELSIKFTLQCMVFFLTSAKTTSEQTPIYLPEKITVVKTSDVDNSTPPNESNIDYQISFPTSPTTVKIDHFLELDIEAVKTAFPRIK